MMSKYEPLQSYLASRQGGEAPMRFEEVERLLGFRLPPSAREHRAWWSNNVGTNVAVKAWRGAGWKTARVDIGSERVVFVRDPRDADAGAPPAPAATQPDIVLQWSGLDLAVRKLIEETAEAGRCSPKAAVERLLTQAVLERRRKVLHWFAHNRTKVESPSDSVDLIREDRDRDEP